MTGGRVRRLARWSRIAALTLGSALLGLLAVSMFAAELTRVFVSQVAEPPVDLPAGVDIRYSDRLVSLIGRGTSSGRASAVTLGSLILVPRQFASLSADARRRLIRHELVHVRQRDRYGRLYLPVYGLLYVVHGYAGHPLELEASRLHAAR